MRKRICHPTHFRKHLTILKCFFSLQWILPETESGLVPVIVDRAVKGAEVSRCDHGLWEVISAIDIHDRQCYESLQDSVLAQDNKNLIYYVSAKIIWFSASFLQSEMAPNGLKCRNSEAENETVRTLYTTRRASYLHGPPQGVVVVAPDHVYKEAQVLFVALSDGHVAPEVNVRS